VTAYRLLADPRADLDVVSTFDWYEREQVGLGDQFLAELRGAYDRVADGPLKYPTVRPGVRRALIRRFPYAVYFSVEAQTIFVLAVLHASRDPAEWQRRSS
jgi:plasmid stabilization system protein ParE